MAKENGPESTLHELTPNPPPHPIHKIFLALVDDLRVWVQGKGLKGGKGGFAKCDFPLPHGHISLFSIALWKNTTRTP